ncbi:hypothetical protein VTN00DRAFT_7257 [Thermoascus crustaceus]|uniref:uncharacterized protein n=1 Tax=Thermoascus crustaceus TaxID=5088 RepID=UPI003743CFBD
MAYPSPNSPNPPDERVGHGTNQRYNAFAESSSSAPRPNSREQDLRGIGAWVGNESDRISDHDFSPPQQNTTAPSTGDNGDDGSSSSSNNNNNNNNTSSMMQTYLDEDPEESPWPHTTLRRHESSDQHAIGPDLPVGQSQPP